MFIHLRLYSGSVYLPCTLSVWYDKRLSKNVNARLNIRLNYSSTSSARISNMVGYTIRPRTLLRTTRGDVWRREGMAPRILNFVTRDNSHLWRAAVPCGRRLPFGGYFLGRKLCGYVYEPRQIIDTLAEGLLGWRHWAGPFLVAFAK